MLWTLQDAINVINFIRCHAFLGKINNFFEPYNNLISNGARTSDTWIAEAGHLRDPFKSEVNKKLT